MSNTEFGDVHGAVKLVAGYSKPWAVCGGWAIDLFLHHVTRPHKDVDFAILRKDQLMIQEYLSSRGWTLEKAVSGHLVPWPMGESIHLPVHTIWCKNHKASPDFLELLFNEVDEVNFHFRRDPSITLPVEKMIISSGLGIPILAPQIVLLYKSGNPEHPIVAADFENVLPKLSSEMRDWLVTALNKMYLDHVWIKALL
jgi:aminoglycoside-2''-adenylyltransferase